MEDTNKKFGVKWSERLTNSPVTVKVKGEWFSLGAEKITLSGGTVAEAPKTQFELDLVLAAFPAYENEIGGDRAKSREQRLKAVLKSEKEV